MQQVSSESNNAEQRASSNGSSTGNNGSDGTHEGKSTTNDSRTGSGGDDGGGEEAEAAAAGSPKSFAKALHLSRYGFGIFLIILVAIIWVGASLWIQSIFVNLDKPFFMTYFNTAGFMLWNIGYLIPQTGWSDTPWKNELDEPGSGEGIGEHSSMAARATTGAAIDDEGGEEEEEGEGRRGRGSRATSEGNLSMDTLRSATATGNENKSGNGDETTPPLLAGDGDTSSERSTSALAPSPLKKEPTGTRVVIKKSRYSLYRIFYAAMLFCPMWFLANCLFNYSLARTSVASNTILSTTSSIWTLLVSRWLLKDPINAIKIMAICLSVGGTTMVAFSDETKKEDAQAGGHSSSERITGDALALISAVFYAAYTTVLRWCLPDDDRYSMGQAFGAVGVVNTVIMWPGFIMLNYAGIEPFELPSWDMVWRLVVNTLIGTNLSDVLWAKSVILTSPLIATLGLSLTTPFAMLADAVFKAQSFSALYVCGAIVVTTGFVLANVKFKRCSRC